VAAFRAHRDHLVEPAETIFELYAFDQAADDIRTWPASHTHYVFPLYLRRRVHQPVR
jgi:hypothetical protein